MSDQSVEEKSNAPINAEPSKPVKKKRRIWLWVLAIFVGLFILGKMLPDVPQAEEPPDDPLTIGLSYDEVMNGFEQFMVVKEGKPIDGKPNFIGNYNTIMIQIIGEKENIRHASITMGNDGTQEVANFNSLSLTAFLKNTIPNCKEVALKFFTNEVGAGKSEASMACGDKRMNITFVRELGFITVSISKDTLSTLQ